MNWIRSPYNLISCFNFLYVVFYNAALLNHLWDSQQEAGLQWWEVLHCVNKWTRHIFLLCVRLLKAGRVAVLLRPRLLTAPPRAFFDHLLSGTPAKRLNDLKWVPSSFCVKLRLEWVKPRPGTVFMHRCAAVRDGNFQCKMMQKKYAYYNHTYIHTAFIKFH